MIQQYDCKEKLDAGHSQGLESETHSIYKTFRQLQLFPIAYVIDMFGREPKTGSSE